MAMNQRDLDQAALHGCQTPGCPHDHEPELYLHGRCHQKAPVQVKYNANTGTLFVECAVCEALIAEIEVA